MTCLTTGDLNTDGGRVTFDLKEQAADPSPKAGKPDKVVATLREENEEKLICHESLTVDVMREDGLPMVSQNKQLIQTPKCGAKVEDTWL